MSITIQGSGKVQITTQGSTTVSQVKGVEILQSLDNISVSSNKNNINVQTINGIDILDNNNQIGIVKCAIFTMPVLSGFDTFSDALSTLGVGQLFYFNPANLEGATPYSVHITK